MRTKGYNLVFNSKFKSDLPDGINRRTKTNRIVSVRAGLKFEHKKPCDLKNFKIPLHKKTFIIGYISQI